MKVVHYSSSRKNPHHSEAIATGFDAQCVPIETAKRVPGAFHLCGGLQFGGLEIMKDVRQSGEPYIFFDRAYFGGGPGTDVLRAVPGAYQHHWIGDGSDSVEMKPWREDGRHVLLAIPSPEVSGLFGLSEQIREVRWKLAKMDRPVMESVKGDPRPLAERFKDCWAVVTWTSNVAVEAVCAGIPVFVSQFSAARPVGLGLEELALIESPRMPGIRSQWAAHLAAGQFTVEAIRAGAARHLIHEGERERATA